ncbi:Transcription initiation factor TFIID subunit 2 [Lamellibrachia satsuma]|nr:Transcription initiation factor TFIID subunit 2 [Lamellibrachia satsuma]
MKKDPKNLHTPRAFRLAHQTLAITAFNFETESLIGYVELLIYPLRPDLRRVKINSKQCCIYRVSINEMWDASFSYNDPTLEICQGDSKQRNLDFFEHCHTMATKTVDAENANGEITIKMPPEANLIITEMKPFRVCIEFSLEQPKGGIKFVVPDLDGTMLERGAHLFTYGHENSSRLWFPCLDSYSEVCTWKLEFSVDIYLTAVSCGDLIETVYTPDLRKKTYHYYLSVPTAAPNIALAVGPFEVLVDPNMHEVTHFCLPHLLPILKHSTAFLHEAFEFYEELLSSRFPYSCYKQVFVDHSFGDMMPFATLTIFSTNILHTAKIIDQAPLSRQIMAEAIAKQFFGCFIAMHSWSDAWLPKGIAGYLSSLYRKTSFGNNEYRYWVSQDLTAIQQYEQNVGGIVLDPSHAKESSMYFSTKYPHTMLPLYADMYDRKSGLIIRMLEIRVGQELLLQVFNKLLALAMNAAQQKFTSNTWSNMSLATITFLKCISTVTGKDIQAFMEQWVHQNGCARFCSSFIFNRKRNVVELQLRQELASKGALKYAGPLIVAIQELDGTFNHNFKIEENKTKFEITCHSKSRRNKKKKIPLCTGEEVDMDLADMDAESPVLWLRIDPDMTTLRQVKLEQPDFMWQYQLRYERDIIAQLEAINALEEYATPKTRLALTDTIENEKCFYRVRIAAAECLAKVANAMSSSWVGPPAMMTIFRKFFGSHSCPSIVRQNNFSNFQNYFIQKHLPLAMSKLRTVHGICPTEVFQFLLDLFKYNDNNRNKYSDNYYRATLVDALAATVTPAVTTVTITGQGPSTDALTTDTKLILEEITRYLNMEKLLPCYRLTVTVSCLRAIRTLQKFGHLPSDPSIFKSYAVVNNFMDVRLVALEALVDYTKVESSVEMLGWLLDVAEQDPEPFVRHKVLQFLTKSSLFSRKDNSPLSNETLVERLWKMMNCHFSHDSRLRCDVADLYFTLYGRTRPSCLPIPESVMVLNLKERKTMLNPSVYEDSMSDEDARERQMKRQSESPLPPFGFEHSSSVDPGMKATSADDAFKLRVTHGVNSPEPASLSSPLGLPGTPPVRCLPLPESSTYSQAFMKFAIGDQSQPGSVSQPTASQLPQSVASPGISQPLGVDDMGARLSEDSSSNSLPPLQPTTEESAKKPPTSFDVSMFAASVDISNSPAPPALEGTASLTSTTAAASGATAAPHDPAASGHKHHKGKKKKKKNKHKHKHSHDKHRHEKHDRGRDKSSSDKEKTKSQPPPPPPVSSALEPLSSGSSNPNSPVVDILRQPSSPEFEVI